MQSYAQPLCRATLKYLLIHSLVCYRQHCHQIIKIISASKITACHILLHRLIQNYDPVTTTATPRSILLPTRHPAPTSPPHTTTAATTITTTTTTTQQPDKYHTQPHKYHTTPPNCGNFGCILWLFCGWCVVGRQIVVILLFFCCYFVVGVLMYTKLL